MTDTLVVWGFLLSFLGLCGAGCYEAFKIVAVLPSAFESSSAVWRNPMGASENEYPANPSGGRRMTAQQRAQDEERAGRGEMPQRP
ncbi:MAG: hypothetical protein ABSA83_08685 [Verrucomicrobiota bacterium]